MSKPRRDAFVPGLLADEDNVNAPFVTAEEAIVFFAMYNVFGK